MLGPKERWSAARRSFDGTSAVEGWMIILAVIALIISVILALWTFFQRRRTENLLRQNISELAITNDKLRQEIAQLKQEQLEVLESIIDAEPPEKEVPSLNAQEIKALSEFAKLLL
jgi:hypothetical protein